MLLLFFEGVLANLAAYSSCCQCKLSLHSERSLSVLASYNKNTDLCGNHFVVNSQRRDYRSGLRG